MHDPEQPIRDPSENPTAPDLTFFVPRQGRMRSWRAPSAAPAGQSPRCACATTPPPLTSHAIAPHAARSAAPLPRFDPRELAAGGWEEGLRRLTARAPNCVLWDDRDPYIPASYAERFGAREVHHFPEYGHWLPAEAAAAVAEHLGRFLSD